MEKKPTMFEKGTGNIVKFLGEVSFFKELSRESLEKIFEKIQMNTFAVLSSGVNLPTLFYTFLMPYITPHKVKNHVKAIPLYIAKKEENM